MGRFAGSGPWPGETRRPRPFRRRQPVLTVTGDSGTSRWQAWCDGTALPNPGRIGIGIVLVSPQGERREISRLAGSGCNNEAELRALCAVLELASAAGARQLIVHSDSDFVVRHVDGRQQTGIVRFHDLIRQTRELIASLDEVVLHWLPRHRNREADRLARQALGLAEKPAVWPGQTKMRRQNRQKKQFADMIRPRPGENGTDRGI